MNIQIGKITVLPGFILLFAVLFYFDPGWFIPAAFLSICIHEAGHIIALKIFKKKIDGVIFSAFGLSIKIRGDKMSYLEEAMSALSGPAASIAFAYFTATAGNISGYDYMYIIAGISMTYGIFNLILIRPLDGGLAFYALLNIFTSPHCADKISSITERTLIAAVFVAGCLLLISDAHNPTLAAIALWLAFYCCKRGRNSVEF